MPDNDPFPKTTVGSQGPEETVGPVRSQTNVFDWFGFLGYVNVNETESPARVAPSAGDGGTKVIIG